MLRRRWSLADNCPMPQTGTFTAAARKVWHLACAGATIDALHVGTGASFGLPAVLLQIGLL